MYIYIYICFTVCLGGPKTRRFWISRNGWPAQLNHVAGSEQMLRGRITSPGLPPRFFTPLFLMKESCKSSKRNPLYRKKSNNNIIVVIIILIIIIIILIVIIIIIVILILLYIYTFIHVHYEVKHPNI